MWRSSSSKDGRYLPKSINKANKVAKHRPPAARLLWRLGAGLGNIEVMSDTDEKCVSLRECHSRCLHLLQRLEHYDPYLNLELLELLNQLLTCLPQFFLISLTAVFVLPFGHMRRQWCLRAV